jgi:hypothetical protein
MTKERALGDARMSRQDVFRMIKRGCQQAELGAAANCYSFRATGIAAYLLNGGTLSTRRRSPRMRARGPQNSLTARPMKLRSMKSKGSEFSPTARIGC